MSIAAGELLSMWSELELCGLGFERLMLFVTGMQNIRDVIPFPRTPKSAQF